MKNQSTLNDVFKFVNIGPGNILKTYPLQNSHQVALLEDSSEEEKREKANEFFNKDDFSIKSLDHGETILSEFENNRQNPNNLISAFYDIIQCQYEIDFNSDSFRCDIESLSDALYLLPYADTPVVPDEIQNAYLAYNILARADADVRYRQVSFGKIDLSENATSGIIKNIGIANLMVVKQHILRYEATEISYIENVMKGESRSKEHRFLDRFEETFIREKESTKETEVEKELKERFEMNRETSKTIEEDHKLSADLSISASYGPTLSIQSDLGYSFEHSESFDQSASSTYAKDVMDRSLEKVTERVREERITKILKENETINKHAFENGPSDFYSTADIDHISGIYQFVDKIYKAQVFNYGKRQMFDLMIPEPASFLHFLNKRGEAEGLSEIDKVPKFDISPFEIEYEANHLITGLGLEQTRHYSNLIKAYKANGVKLHPSPKTFTFNHEEPAGDTGDGSLTSDEGPFPVSPKVIEVEIVSGYIPRTINISIIGSTDRVDTVQFYFVIGSDEKQIVDRRIPHYPDYGIRSHRRGAGAHERVTFTGKLGGMHELELPPTFSVDDQNKLYIGYFPVESANHIINGEVHCEPSPELIKEWQLETFDIITSAYQDRLLEYESKMAQLKLDEQGREGNDLKKYGVPPSKQKQVILTELKKHAISIFTDNYYQEAVFQSNYPLYDAASEHEPPKIDRIKAKAQGDFIRFFEHAFEWSQMQYAFYPYFWSKVDNWTNRFKETDINYEYEQFLQAGSARLVLSVRPGYEKAVNHFLENNEIWLGEGAPEIENPLYLSIIDEIKEASGNLEQDPEPVGEPWEVRLPTSLIKLRKQESLPSWEENPDDSWEWVSVEED
ncbi:MAG: hypothetical protein AAF489_01965 [Bacteroidota bacterium]